MTETFVNTKAGRIAITQTEGSGLPVLLIHGNSSCKEVFRNQIQGSVGNLYKCIAMDLPGHGGSENARDPEAIYSMPGYAATALELMDLLGYKQYAVLGWSLGGHIGIEMISRSEAIIGLMITGSPPIAPGEAMAEGFLPSEHMHLAGQNEFSDAEIEAYAHATCGVKAPFEDFLLKAVARTDGRAREMMFGSFMAGKGCNQQETATHSSVPLAIVNGNDEPFVNNDFVRSLTYDNLWEDRVHLIEGIGHAPFWEAPAQYDPYLKRFLGFL